MKRNTSRLICTYTTTNFMVLKLFNCFYDNPVTEKEINWFRKRHYCVMSVVYLARVWRAWVAITSCLDHVALQVVLATELLLATCAWIWLQPCKMFKFKSQSCAVWWREWLNSYLPVCVYICRAKVPLSGQRASHSGQEYVSPSKWITRRCRSRLDFSLKFFAQSIHSNSPPCKQMPITTPVKNRYYEYKYKNFLMIYLVLTSMTDLIYTPTNFERSLEVALQPF